MDQELGTRIYVLAVALLVVAVASGCTAQLVEYDRIAPSAGATAFARRVHDVHAFVASHPALGSLRFRPLEARVLLHTPCTQRNVVKAPDALRKLLERGLTLEPLPQQPRCCGAAGSYFVTQPQMADALLAPKLARARETQATYVVSSNVGCAMHLAAGLRRAGIRTAVANPLALLNAQRASTRVSAAGAPPARPA